ncbi:MAG: GNAT family N-acetyltransferase [Dehalococcoidales bacterium]|nr:GNAT family N-acetyltransferase [Dehalococcoidales bacterium]
MNIRPMAVRDKTAVQKILVNTPEFTPAEVTLAEQVLDECLQDPENSGYFTLVAETDSAVAGFICYGPTPITEGTWDIYWIAVDHGIQGRGIGRSLMTAAEENIQAAGGRLVLVETSSKPGYEKTNLFYQGIGYKEAARIADFYMIGDDQVIYEKRFKTR